MPVLSSKQGLGLAALLLSASTFLSRLMGLVRDKVISWQFGASQEADMYFAAFVVPDCINYLLAGGFMSITIIPLLSKAFARDEEEAWSFFSSVFSLFCLASLCLTGLAMLFAERLAELVAPGFSASELQRLAFFMRLILPAQVFFLSGAACTALLFLRKEFTVPALAPLLYNGAIIAGGVLTPLLYASLTNTSLQEATKTVGMTGYCIGVPVGAFLGAFLLPLLAAQKGGLRLTFRLRHALMLPFCLTALPLMLGQTVIMLDEQFLRIFGSMLSEGSVSLLNYARRLTQVPIGLVGQAAAVASYPFLVDLLTKNDTEQFAKTLQKAFRGGLILIIPIVAWMFANALPIITLIFHGGRFGPAESLKAAPLLQIMLLAVPLWMLYMILVRAFYARQDTLTPAITGTLVTICVLPIYYFVSARISVEAIAITSALSVSGYILWLFAIWYKRFGSACLHGLFRHSLTLVLLSAAPAFLSFLLQEWLGAHLPFSPVLNAFFALAISGIAFLSTTLPLLYRFVPEAGDILTRLVKKLRAKRSA